MSPIEQHISDLRKQADSLATTALVLSRDAASYAQRAADARALADQLEALARVPA